MLPFALLVARIVEPGDFADRRVAQAGVTTVVLGSRSDPGSSGTPTMAYKPAGRDFERMVIADPNAIRLKWTAKIPFNPAMTIASYHQGTQSITKEGFCLQSGNVTDAMTISDINALVASKGGVIYQTTSVDSHAVKYPCDDETQKILGDASKRVNAMPLCSVPYNPSTGVALNNQVDCEAAGGSFDHALYVQMKSAWYTVDLYKEHLLQKLYFS